MSPTERTRVLIPSGALGLNYDAQALECGLDMAPDIIVIDGGSTDSGPAYLGQGKSKYARSSTLVEWRGLMRARSKIGVPLVIGSAGTCGTDSTVDWMLDITREVAAELGEPLKVAVLRSQQNMLAMVNALDAGRIKTLPGGPEITEKTFHDCHNIVALAGAEQIQQSLQTGADIVIAGRTSDAASIAALPLMRGCAPGPAWHGAKIGECGALCASNPQSGVVMIDFDSEGFTVHPLADGSLATPHTVSAHMLYENSDPFILHEPGGHLDVSDATYASLDARRVRVTGSKWVKAPRYTVKLEGARAAGFQSIALALLRDPRYVRNASDWARDIEMKCRAKVRDRLRLGSDSFRIELRLIGQSASFGVLETVEGDPVEIGVLGIVTARTAELAEEIGKMLNPYLLHHPLTVEEEQPTFAFPFSPAEIQRGATYEFCLHHVLYLNDPMEAFRLEEVQLDPAR